VCCFLVLWRDTHGRYRGVGYIGAAQGGYRGDAQGGSEGTRRTGCTQPYPTTDPSPNRQWAVGRKQLTSDEREGRYGMLACTCCTEVASCAARPSQTQHARAKAKQSAPCSCGLTAGTSSSDSNHDES
jgi:hypothetical protein